MVVKRVVMRQCQTWNLRYSLAMNMRGRLVLLAMLTNVPQFALSAEGNENYFQILYDTSTPISDKFKPDFGYAVYLEFQGKRILLDTGTNAEILAHNIAAAGIDIAKLDAVVMTHDHHDHAGGLAWLRQKNNKVPVYIPPGQSYPVHDGIVIEQNLALSKDLMVIRGHSDVPTAGIYDDLSLAIRTQAGLYVLSSCSHSGVAGIVDRAQQAFNAPVYLFSGGARLIFRDPEDTDTVAQALKTRGVKQISPSHCSLSHAVEGRMRNTLGDSLVASRLGAKVTLSAP